MSSPIESGHASPHPLTQFGLLAVTGSDAESFLQGQTTCHVGHITPQQSGLGALCNLKGRVIANFTIVRTAQGFFLLLPLELLETVETRLRRYVMRSDVTLEAVTGQWSLFGLVGDASKALRTQYGIVLSNDNYAATTADGWIVINAPTADAERTLLMIRRDQAEAFWSAFKPNEAIDSCSDSQWLLEDIVSGIATITTATEELFVPQMINLDLLGGVSFDKGCYTGQEVVARMRFSVS